MPPLLFNNLTVTPCWIPPHTSVLSSHTSAVKMAAAVSATVLETSSIPHGLLLKARVTHNTDMCYSSSTFFFSEVLLYYKTLHEQVFMKYNVCLFCYGWYDRIFSYKKDSPYSAIVFWEHDVIFLILV